MSGTATLVGVISGDTVTPTGTTSGTFANKNVGLSKAVSVSGYSLTGPNAGNYTLLQPTGLTANISAASLTVSGLSGVNLNLPAADLN